MTDEPDNIDQPRPEMDLDKMRRRALARKDYKAEVLRVTNGLTSEEKNFCQNIVVFGVDYLRESLGWAMDVVRQFVERAEVQREIEHLTTQYKDRQAIQDRTQFFAQLKINGMVPAALAILAKAMRGHVFEADGSLKERAPDRNQIEAAMQVLDRANIQGAKYNTNVTAPNVDARQVHLHVTGAADKLKLDPQRREKLGKMVDKFIGRAAALLDANARTATRQQPVDDAKDAELADGDD